VNEQTPAPGWYPDPVADGGQRYWDGTEWTSASIDAEPVQAPASPLPGSPSDAASTAAGPQQAGAWSAALPSAAPGTGSGPTWTNTGPATHAGPTVNAGPASHGVPAAYAGPTAYDGPAANGSVSAVVRQLRGLNPRVALGIVAVVVLAIVLMTAGGSSTHTVQGTFGLYSSDFLSMRDGASCSGSGGYSDIRQGLQVRATDDTGRLIASSNLGTGTVDGMVCEFSFHLDDIPRSSYYSFEVGRRGELTFSHEEMVADGWTVAFSLGL
jgi:hypothetical protein